jgi:uncharacterized repeat protein (TIGR01451 family)
VSVREPQVRRDSQLFAKVCEAVLRRGHKVQFQVQGQSMQPTLLDGDEVVVAPTTPGELRRGEVVLSESRDGLRVHRVAVCEVTSGSVTTRSDTGLEMDSPASRVFGKVTARRRNSGVESLSISRVRLGHPARILMRRIRVAAAARLRRSAAFLLGLAALTLLSAAFAVPAAYAQADLTMTQATSVSVVDRGINFNYTEIATNNGPNAVPAGTLVVYQQTPPNTTLQSITVDANWNCSNPGAAGPIICIYAPALASGANTAADPIVFTLSVNGGTAYGTTILNSATITSQTTDPVPSNNTSVTTVLVEAANQADMALSMTAAPTPVFLSSTLTYAIQVQNLGQANAATVQVVDTIPGTTTFVSATAPAGWTCAGTTTVTCSLTGTMAQGATATIKIAVTSPSTPGPITNSATVTSVTADPVMANNTATVITVVQPLVCATPGKDGAGGVLSGVVNTYYRASANGTLAAGSTAGVTLAAGSGPTPISPGDLLLIIQMQDALINNTNSSSYGHGVPGDPATGSTNLQSSGQFEFVTATNSVPLAGGALTFTGTGANGGPLNTYVRAAYSGGGNHGQQRYEVIRVPQYTSATLSSALVPLPWDGNLGGVLAIDVASQLTLGGTVSANALGFRGGGGLLLTGSGGGVSTDYVSQSANNTDGSKGEGIAGTPRYIAPATITTTTVPTNTGAEGYSNGSFARGAPGNAGGGGTDGDPPNNDFNSGGGAGGNGGTGGLGGYGWNSFTVLNSTDGGFGGAAFPTTTSAVIMGGGGGAGTSNNGSYFISAANHDSNSIDNACTNVTCTGIYSSGGAGGGIVIVHTGSTVGTGTITSNGQSTLSTDNDSTGGGGAGGSIIFFANTGALAGLTVNANGGNAGNTWPETAPGTFTTAGSGARHGPGGGGGGGVILLSSAPAALTVSGGANGYTNTVQDSFGATPGQGGVTATNHVITETPGAQSGAYCASADLAVTNSGSPAVVQPTGNITYTQTVTNNGPLDALNAVFAEAVPTNTTFQSITIPSGWSCVIPAVNGTGNISCTNPDVANATNSQFTVVVKVNAGTANQTQIVDVATITSGTNDPKLANNSATVITIVGVAGTANLLVTESVPPTVLAGSNVIYTVVAQNQGPSGATGVGMTISIPSGTTFVSLPNPAGWICSASATTATCTASGTYAAGSSSTFNLTVNVPIATASGTQLTSTATISSPTPDPNPTNNVSSATTIVGTAGQADLAVAASGSPNPVTDGNNITYVQTVTNNGPSSVANATFTDTIPANTTLAAAFTAPAGWNCNSIAVGGTGTFTCTLTGTLAIGATVNFPLVVNVNLGTAPGTTITNTPAIATTAGDPNSANNSVTVTTVVASPSQADVAIVKTAAPEPVDQGTNLTYTLQVTNNGPAVAQGVTVTDVIPAQVAYSSSSTSQGSCSYTVATTTVSCPLGSIGVGGTVVITINVTANTFSSASTSSNTATVSSTTSDPNLANNTSTAVSTIQAPTAVDLTFFRATQRADGSAVIEWRTREEARNLGFRIYREDAAGRRQITPSLIAGSAFLLRGAKPQHSAKQYHWIDPNPPGSASYWLEDVDVNGARVTHGPVNLETGSPEHAAELESAQQARLLSQISVVPAQGTITGTGALVTARPELPTLPPGTARVSVADHQAVKISVKSEGWYRVTEPQLIAAGFDPRTEVRSLHLYAEGVEQPLLISGPQAGPLTPAGEIEFYGTGIDTPFSGTRVYWLIHDGQHSNRILPARPGFSGSAAPNSFPFSVVREDRITYFAALPNGENADNFFGAVITSDPVMQDLLVAHSDPSSSLPTTLDLTLQGGTSGQAHRVSVQFNGASIGEMDFAGQENVKQTFPVDSTLLHDGTNTVTLTALEGDNDVSVVESIALHYPHTYEADANWLRAIVQSGNQVMIGGFTNSQIRAFDITDPLHISELAGKIALVNGNYSLALDIARNFPTERTVLAFSADQISQPVALTSHTPTFLDDRRGGADIVMITHPDFAASLTPLVRLRQGQGHHVAVVTTEQIYDEFNFGERSPFAIREYLQNAAAQWQRRPQAVLLVGDASFDPRNYLGLGELDFVPTRLIETAAFKTASDDWFTDFQQTGFATISTGRLPVRTSADVSLVVSKIVGYERGSFAGGWNAQALFIAYQNIDADFTDASKAAGADISNLLQTTQILADGQDPATVKPQILAALNNGALIVDYNGHGAEQQWSFSDLLDVNDTAELSNGGRLPVYLLMDCLNGFFQDVYAQSLAVSLLLAPNGGAVAVWASSGFTDEPPQASMNKSLLQAIAASPEVPLGKLILIAKKGVASNDVRRTWILFGDPAMKLQISLSTPRMPEHRPGTRQEKK